MLDSQKDILTRLGYEGAIKEVQVCQGFHLAESFKVSEVEIF
jgi:hypothetical protein